MRRAGFPHCAALPPQPWCAMHLTRFPETYAVSRAAPDAKVPAGVLDTPSFVTVSRTADELSVVAPEAAITGMEIVEGGWALFKLHGPFAFDQVGVVAGLSRPLAAANIGIFVISTYDTDYILVKSQDAAASAALWREQGHEVEEGP